MNVSAVLPVLRVERIVFSYPQRHVFNGWSTDFNVGLSWIRGRNGSGKSTLLQLLAGALPLQSGRLSVRDIDAAQRPMEYRREVFWCGPGGIAFDHLRPPEYFGFLCSMYPRFDADALGEHIAGFGLAPHMDMRLATLSAGTQRKVWLAAALVVGTAAVLIDEPLNALDASSTTHLQRVLLRCAADPQRAWVVASHDPLVGAGDLAACIDLPDPQGI